MTSLKLDINTFTKIYLALTLRVLSMSVRLSQRRYLITASEAQLITRLLCRVRLDPARVHTPSRPMFWATSTNHCHDIPAMQASMTVRSSPIRRKAGWLHALSVLVCHLIVNRCALNRNTLWVPVPALQDDHSLPGYCRTDHLRLQSPWYVELYSIPVFIVVHSDEPIR